jgi:hypothetical protein
MMMMLERAESKEGLLGSSLLGEDGMSVREELLGRCFLAGTVRRGSMAMEQVGSMDECGKA